MVLAVFDSLALAAADELKEAGKTKSPPKELTVDLGKGVKLEMVLIPAGEYMMGLSEGDKMEAFDMYVPPQHRVRITKPFYLGKYLVTQEQWQTLMGSNPSRFKGPKNPVEQISWDDCQQFLGKLNAKVGGGAGKFQLPSEAQWEYACRAGSKTKYCFGDDETRLGDYAWYDKNSGNTTHPVGAKKPNAWGLYDMHGNVVEWCQDWWQDAFSYESPLDDPTGAPAGRGRVYRGCGWDNPARCCRSSSRGGEPSGFSYFNLGLRVSRVPADK
jgi:formylglycine-generating enzyme required for sulfatase activity